MAEENSEKESRGTAFRAYVEAEIASAWLRKSSFETRSFSIITADFGIVTLYFLLQTQLGITVHAYTGHWATLLKCAIVVVVVSVILAGVSALPLNYPVPEDSAFDDLLNEIDDVAEKDQRQEILESRVKQLKTTLRSNDIKASFVLTSTIAFAIAVASLVASIAHAMLAYTPGA